MATQEHEQRQVYNVHEGIVFLIELTPTLIFPDPDSGKSHLQVILEALSEAMDHSVITLPGTGYGLYLFNGQNTTKGLPIGIECLFDLRDLNYSNMKIVQDILEENSNDHQDDDRPHISLEDRFKPIEGEGSVNPLDDVLRVAQDDLLVKKDLQNLYSNKKIFLFTDNDTPIDDSNVQQKNILRNTRNNLEDSLITITPFFISTPAKPFNETVYKELMTLTAATDDNSDDLFNINEDTLLFDGPNSRPIDVSFIKQRILRRKEIKRKQFDTVLNFNDDLTVGVKGYTFYSHEKPSRSKFLYESVDFRKNVYSKRRLIDEVTGYEFEKTAKVFKFGINEDDYFALTDEQIQTLQSYDEKNDTFLRILGFKDEKLSLKPNYQTTKSNAFLIPDEDSFEGSTRTLSALYQSLQKSKKCAILFGKLRKGTQPSIFSLQPSSQPYPQGFFLYRLPFLDDIRQVPAGFEMFDDPSEQLQLITKLVLMNLKLKHGYSPSEFKNPTLQQHYRVLHDYLLQVEQSALDDESTETRLAKDDTLAKIHQIRERVERSQLDNDGKDRLFRYIKDWNRVYNQEKE